MPGVEACVLQLKERVCGEQVRFITVNLDQNESTMRLTGRLQIAGTPTFLYYDAGEEVLRLKGSNIIKFMGGLDELLARPRAEVAAASCAIEPASCAIELAGVKAKEADEALSGALWA